MTAVVHNNYPLNDMMALIEFGANSNESVVGSPLCGF